MQYSTSLNSFFERRRMGKRSLTTYKFIAFFITFGMAISVQAGSIVGRIIDNHSKTALPYANILIEDEKGKQHHLSSAMDGSFIVANIKDGTYKIMATYVGYISFSKTYSVKGKTNVTIALLPDENSLNEVVVTAKEGQSITSSSVIDRKAIEHLQPSSFTDLLSLLPGGHKSLPNLTNANAIYLRQAGVGNANYDISALGTVFVSDGIPLNTNANMQQVLQASAATYGDVDAGKNHVKTGVDMRQIPTDNIESVEVIRGIAPVEYGDLTSGVVVIKRKLKPTPLEARFKADSYSKLFYVGKGMEIGKALASFSLDYLDAKADPRNPLNNYKRLTFSARLQNQWNTSTYQLRSRTNLDYTGSFDNEKHDPEILTQKNDRYKSSYNRFGLSHSLSLLPKEPHVLKSLHLDLAARYESSQIKQDRQVNLARDVAVSTILQEGEHDGIYLPYSYLAHVTVDGRPLNLFAKMKGLLDFKTFSVMHNANVGIEWKMDKNYGHGQIYNPERPLSPNTPYRPRDYRTIPAEHLLSFYAQDVLSWTIGQHRFTSSLGIRGTQMLNLASKYAMSKRIFIDPRVNFQWRLPSINVQGKDLIIDLNGGWGRQTKFPTLLNIYPDKVYRDIVELNYYHANPDFRRLHLRTYLLDVTNYDLMPATNNKWELRLGAAYDGNLFSLTYFHENLSSGFRASSIARPFYYKDYDESSINGKNLSSSPRLENIAYTERNILGLFGKTTNGSRLIKEGIEWQFSSKRLKTLKTRFTVNGAYFKTTYTNSEPLFNTITSAVIDGEAVNDKYIGYYDNSSGSVKEQLSTNFMADTYIPRLGLTFSLTAECVWFTTSQQMRENGTPLAYMSVDGKIHPYTEASKADKYLKWLVKQYNDALWQKHREPLYVLFNLKVTKEFGRWMKLALFIDRMLDYMPDYKTNSGLIVRRTAKPYFGMEINFSI